MIGSRKKKRKASRNTKLGARTPRLFYNEIGPFEMILGNLGPNILGPCQAMSDPRKQTGNFRPFSRERPKRDYDN